MQVRLDTPNTQPSSLTVDPILNSRANEQLYQTRLVSAKQSKPAELFWKIWEYFTSLVSRACDWILQKLNLHTAAAAKPDIVSQIIDEPKVMAIQFADDPVNNICTLFEAALDDPKKLEKFLFAKENKKTYERFLTEFKSVFTDTDIFRGEKGSLLAFTALMNPCIDVKVPQNKLFISLLKFLKNHIPLLGEAASYTATVINKSLGESPTEGAIALSYLCENYLPRIEEHAIANPTAFYNFIDKFFKLKVIDKSLLDLSRDLPKQCRPDKNEWTFLEKCLENNGLIIKQINNDLAVSVLKAERTVNVQMTFLQGLIKSATPEIIDEFIQAVGNKHNLVTCLASKLKEIIKDEKNHKRAVENLPKAIAILKRVYQNYAKAPREE